MFPDGPKPRIARMHPEAATAAPAASTTTAAKAIDGGASSGRARLITALCGFTGALVIWCYGGGGGGGPGGGRLTRTGFGARFVSRTKGAGRGADASSSGGAYSAGGDENQGGGDREGRAAAGDAPPPPSPATRRRRRGRARRHRGQQRRATTLELDEAAVAREGRNTTTHAVPPPPLPRDGGGREEGLTKRYDSFEQYAEEHFAGVGTDEPPPPPPLPVPIVPSRKGPKFSSSLPAAIIIGVQVKISIAVAYYAKSTAASSMEFRAGAAGLLPAKTWPVGCLLLSCLRRMDKLVWVAENGVRRWCTAPQTKRARQHLNCTAQVRRMKHSHNTIVKMLCPVPTPRRRRRV